MILNHITQLKACKRCNSRKVIGDFGLDRRQKDELNPICKQCQAKDYRAKIKRFAAQDINYNQLRRIMEVSEQPNRFLTRLLSQARYRAKLHNQSFTISK